MGSAYIRNGVVRERYVVSCLGNVGWICWRGEGYVGGRNRMIVIWCTSV
jgi:hypothetical protein